MYKYFLCLLIISSSFSYDGFRQGEIELSGNAEYNITMRDSSPSVNTFIFQPNTSIYFQDGLFIGPFIQWGRQWDNRSTSNVLGLGGNIGYLFKNESGTYPYLGLLGGYLQSSVDFNGAFAFSNSNSGTLLSLYLGIKKELNKNVFMNVQPTFSFYNLERYPYQTFGIILGFSFKVKSATQPI